MTSSLVSNLATNSDRSRESKKKRKKNNQILNQQNRDQQNQNKNRWKTEAEQQIYSSKLLQALRQVRLSSTSSSSSSSLSSSASKVRESFAVVKKSEDPYEDFKRSMLEMILEKQMFEVKDLEELLHCFLSLNSRQHHVVIVEAFSEIWEVLFSKSPVMNRRDSKNR